MSTLCSTRDSPAPVGDSQVVPPSSPWRPVTMEVEAGEEGDELTGVRVAPRATSASSALPPALLHPAAAHKLQLCHLGLGGVVASPFQNLPMTDWLSTGAWHRLSRSCRQGGHWPQHTRGCLYLLRGHLRGLGQQRRRHHTGGDDAACSCPGTRVAVRDLASNLVPHPPRRAKNASTMEACGGQQTVVGLSQVHTRSPQPDIYAAGAASQPRVAESWPQVTK